MEKIFKECDRCCANVSSFPEQSHEVEIKMETEETGRITMKEIILCNDCVNSFIKWFSPINPFTGKNFIKY